MFNSLVVVAAMLLVGTNADTGNVECREADELNTTDINMDELVNKRLNILVESSPDDPPLITFCYGDIQVVDSANSTYTWDATISHRYEGRISFKNLFSYKNGIMKVTDYFSYVLRNDRSVTWYILAQTDENAMLIYLCPHYHTKMYKLIFTVAAVFVAATELCEAVCKFTDQIRPVDVDFDEVAKKRYNIVYGTVNGFSVTVDHAYFDWTKTGEGTYRVTNAIFRSGGTTMLRNSTTVYSNGVMQETFDDKDESGKNYKATSYILAKTNENAILFYCCTERDYPEDLRFIIVPDGVTLSDASLKQLMDADKKFSFNSNLFKLPNKL